MVEPLYKFMMKTKLIVMLGLLFALPAVLKAEAARVAQWNKALDAAK